MASSNKDIPSDIIELSILPKLPSKSLLKFMSVSKSWYSLIKNPKFIDSHLKHHKSLSRQPNNQLILLRCPKPSPTYYFYRLDNPVFCYTKLRTPPVKFHHVLACCNGIVCLHAGSLNLILWNPSINKFRYIPPLQQLSQLIDFSFALGVGYNSLEDNYKLVMIIHGCQRPVNAHVYSVNRQGEGTSSLGWKDVSLSLPKYSARIYHISRCCYVNELVHWIIFRHPRKTELFDTTSIMTFDPKTDCFGEMKFPEMKSKKHDADVELAVMSDSVAVVKFIREIDVAVVWRMEECKAWKVMYIIKLSSDWHRKLWANEGCFKWWLLLPPVLSRFFHTIMSRKHQQQVVIATSSGTLIVVDVNNSGSSGVYNGVLAITAGKAYSYTESLVLLD